MELYGEELTVLLSSKAALLPLSGSLIMLSNSFGMKNAYFAHFWRNLKKIVYNSRQIEKKTKKKESPFLAAPEQIWVSLKRTHIETAYEDTGRVCGAMQHLLTPHPSYIPVAAGVYLPDGIRIIRNVTTVRLQEVTNKFFYTMAIKILTVQYMATKKGPNKSGLK